MADPQTAIPAIAKDARLIELIEDAIKRIPTCHDLHLGDARAMQLQPESVHLVVTSPPTCVNNTLLSCSPISEN